MHAYSINILSLLETQWQKQIRKIIPVAVIIFNQFNEKSSLSEELLPPICSHDQVFY